MLQFHIFRRKTSASREKDAIEGKGSRPESVGEVILRFQRTL